MHIEFPDRLTDEEWAEAYQQFQYLLKNNMLPIQLKD